MERSTVVISKEVQEVFDNWISKSNPCWYKRWYVVTGGKYFLFIKADIQVHYEITNLSNHGGVLCEEDLMLLILSEEHDFINKVNVENVERRLRNLDNRMEDRYNNLFQEIEKMFRGN